MAHLPPRREVADAGAGHADPDRDARLGRRRIQRPCRRVRSGRPTSRVIARSRRWDRIFSATSIRTARSRCIRAGGSRAVHEVLLDQRVMAGIGNVYKSEILFLSRLHPDTRCGRGDRRGMARADDAAQSFLRANVADGASGIVTYRGLRRTTGRMNPEDRLWVYSRGGQPCRKCGTTIASRKDGDAARVTYWCPSCQTATFEAPRRHEDHEEYEVHALITFRDSLRAFVPSWRAFLVAFR